MTSASPDRSDGDGLRSVLRASGQLGADLLAVDWAATPLGPLDTWPQSLKTIVHVLLTSRFSMWMAWGPELTFFANEAYRRDTLGTKYPWALGKPAREVWAEIWSDIGPRIERVMSTGVASWDESLMLILERSGYREETYHTFSYSPLTNDAGVIVGMLCVVSEDTNRVLNEQRMEILRDLATALTAARTEEEVYAATERQLQTALAPLPFSLVYLLEEDGLSARLVAAAGARPGQAVAPEQELLANPETRWHLAEAHAGRPLLLDRLEERFGDVPTGTWDEPPENAIVTPLHAGLDERPLGYLVAALNRYRPLDAEFRGFVALLASQVAASLANARAYEAERRRAETLAELDRAKTAFFTNVSHEFRTPLTLLLGPTSDLLADQRLDPEQRVGIELVQRNAERLLRLVNTLLDFNRLESGAATARLEPVELGRYTNELAEAFRPALERAGLAYEVDCPLSGIVLVDREMWAKIVANLLSNALKFTFDGSVAVRLRRADADGATFAELSVTDTGIGIEPVQQEHLFERFYRVSGARSRTHEGSGIGLALVAELARLHGGEVDATSAVGVGSTFSVRIPIDGEIDDGEERASDAFATDLLEEALAWLETDDRTSTQTLRAADEAREQARVLVADDNADMRHYLSSLLGTRYDVEVATDGREALALATSESFDLVLTDVMMPNLDGFGLLSGLRNHPETEHLPVIMLTARAGEESAVDGLDAGADDYLVKPFSARELLARVRSSLELERTRREVAHREHRVAEELQRSLLPSRTVTSESLEIATYYQPGVRGTVVGGDWYDVIELGADRTALVVGDVMGRGIRAASVMGQVRAAVRAYARMDLTPARMLELMDAFVGDLGESEIVTCIYAVHDPADHSLTYANAGHLPPIVLAADRSTARLGERPGPPLGAGIGPFPEMRATLEGGDTLLLYTDGLVEQRGAELDARIEELGTHLRVDARPLSDLPAHLAETLCPDGADDDVAILVARVPSLDPSWEGSDFELSDHEQRIAPARHFVASTLRRWAVPDPRVDDIVLVASELVTNAVTHGAPPVRLHMRRSANTVVLEVLDGAERLPHRLDPTPADDHGRGLHIVSLVARDWGIRQVPGGKSTWCVIDIHR